jgi:hypothetical protein
MRVQDEGEKLSIFNFAWKVKIFLFHFFVFVFIFEFLYLFKISIGVFFFHVISFQSLIIDCILFFPNTTKLTNIFKIDFYNALSTINWRELCFFIMTKLSTRRNWCMKNKCKFYFLFLHFLVLMFLFVFAMGFSLFFGCVLHEKLMANVDNYVHVEMIKLFI